MRSCNTEAVETAASSSQRDNVSPSASEETRSPSNTEDMTKELEMESQFGLSNELEDGTTVQDVVDVNSGSPSSLEECLMA